MKTKLLKSITLLLVLLMFLTSCGTKKPAQTKPPTNSDIQNSLPNDVTDNSSDINNTTNSSSEITNSSDINDVLDDVIFDAESLNTKHPDDMTIIGINLLKN